MLHARGCGASPRRLLACRASVILADGPSKYFRLCCHYEAASRFRRAMAARAAQRACEAFNAFHFAKASRRDRSDRRRHDALLTTSSADSRQCPANAISMSPPRNSITTPSQEAMRMALIFGEAREAFTGPAHMHRRAIARENTAAESRAAMIEVAEALGGVALRCWLMRSAYDDRRLMPGRLLSARLRRSRPHYYSIAGVSASRQTAPSARHRAMRFARYRLIRVISPIGSLAKRAQTRAMSMTYLAEARYRLFD